MPTTPKTPVQLTEELAALVGQVNDLAARFATVEADHRALRTEIANRGAEGRLTSLEAYAQNNSRRIDEMEIRYDRVVDEMNVIAGSLTSAVAELAETDEVSGWRQWKEQQRAAGKLPGGAA